ncbi:MAG: acetylornithine/succinylornithine family transaminase [Firmicutes bacterium]|nr:acetylornithine/succinylornithine family transaminase [Bacillota bacterium]
MNGEEIKKIESEKIVHTYGRYDVVAESGKGATLKDVNGKEYIDFTSGIGVNSFGFCDDEWVKAVCEQAGKMQHISNLYYTEPCVKLADLLTEKTGMAKAFFCNSGAEANETAIKIARKYGSTVKGVRSNRIITLIDSFHGRTMATITATGQDHYHEFFTPFVDGFSYCQPGDIEGLKKLMGADVCAIMIEMIQGEGGVLDLDGEFVSAISNLCKENDCLLIVDEVQTGAGRTGKMFAYQHYGLEPDVVTFAKGVGGGLPIGGVICNEKTCDILVPGDHGTTFGGNPVACAGAVSVVSRMDDAFLAAVTAKGEKIRAALAGLDEVEAISGKGMMVGIKLKNKKAGDVVNAGIEAGLLLLTAKDKVRLLPPLSISDAELEKGLEILKGLLTA